MSGLRTQSRRLRPLSPFSFLGVVSFFPKCRFMDDNKNHKSRCCKHTWQRGRWSKNGYEVVWFACWGFHDFPVGRQCPGAGRAMLAGADNKLESSRLNARGQSSIPSCQLAHHSVVDIPVKANVNSLTIFGMSQ